MNSKTLCVIVPFRNRDDQLQVFLPYLQRFLFDRNFHNTMIAIIEQGGDICQPFNRGKLLNVGFALNRDAADYFCFHDVDMLPVNADYSFPQLPTHIATECSQFDYDLPYHEYFGGVTLFSRPDFEDVNGFANEYWGWGAEDDDMLHRCVRRGKIASPAAIPRRQGRYVSLLHKRPIDAELYGRNLATLRNAKEGLDVVTGLSTLKFVEQSMRRVCENITLHTVLI